MKTKMKHRWKVAKEILINPVALGLAILVGMVSAVPVLSPIVSLIFGLGTDLGKGFMDGVFAFIETYRIYFCILPFIIIPLILAEGMYRKSRRFLGEFVPVSYGIESHRNSDFKIFEKATGKLSHTETALDLIFTNKEKVDVNLYANFVSFIHVDKNGIEKTLIKKVNPNNLYVGWNGNRDFGKITVGKSGKQGTMNIVRSQYPYNSLKFFDDVWIPSDEGRYEFEIAINGEIDRIQIEEIIHKDYFLLSRRIVEVGEEGIAPGDTRIIQDEEPIRGWEGGVEFVRFGFAKPASKTEFI